MKTLQEYMIMESTGIDVELEIGQKLSIRDFKKKRSKHQSHFQFEWICPTLMANENATGLVFDYTVDDNFHDLRISIVKGKKELDWAHFNPDEKIIHGVIDLIRRIALTETSFAEFVSKLKECGKDNKQWSIETLG